MHSLESMENQKLILKTLQRSNRNVLASYWEGFLTDSILILLVNQHSMNFLSGITGQDTSVFVVSIIILCQLNTFIILLIECRPKLRQGLSQNCVEACSCAKKTVLSLCERLKTGQVSVNELKIAGKNVNHVLHLFEASSGTDTNKILVPMTTLKNAVNDRNDELKIFSLRQTVLQYLCRFIDDQVQGKLA